MLATRWFLEDGLADFWSIEPLGPALWVVKQHQLYNYGKGQSCVSRTSDVYGKTGWRAIGMYCRLWDLSIFLFLLLAFQRTELD
jgi:hypothetical protein